ncbi:MAG: hypothetical protein IJI46_04845 [Erysipelotrichaceae bacterium]|nr:hypothetical protein [Erysipelotrichaceae bacterium]
MEEKRLKLKKEKKKRSVGSLFADKKKRYLFMFLLMLPFIIAIGVFSSIAYKEAKALMDLANGGQVETKAENIVESMNYILRDNPTDIQKEYFAELKEAIEGEERADDTTIAGLVAKNYVTDFYTWTNKRGQYDIGGLYYVYDGEFENGDHFKENVYLKARDGFYKYISYYGTQYGKENLLEVENVEITRCDKLSSQYFINEHVSYKQDSEGEWYDYREDHGFDAYAVTCRWTYKENTVLPMNQFANSINLMIINRDGRFEVIEASESTIDARTGSEKTSAAETSTDVETSAEENS